ncbi:helix-turn-helix transcriptional regulator [Bacillus pumilus]|nr:helix-turn-helix transcriptional regulator [Bacillus pumilus]WOP23642.1 helix-turn-helix transcriptional regulator [Bacillus pumilus]
MSTIELNKRQEQILQIVKENGPITGEHIADRLNLTRATLRPDLAILTMSGFLEARPRVGYFFTGKTGTQLLADKLKKLQVKDFQSIPVVIHENVSVYDAICTMFLEDVGTLFVVDDHSILTGVLSRKDLLRASIGKQELPSIPVHIIMTRMPNITVCRKEDFIMDVAKHLIEKQIDALPFIKDTDKAFEVVGRIRNKHDEKYFVSLSENEII